MRRKLIPLMAGLVLATTLTGCGDVIGVMQTNADAQKITAESQRLESEAQRLSADSQHIQAQTDAETARALVATANARADDLRLVVALVACLAAASLGMSFAVFLWARNQVRQPPSPVAYYQIGPQPQPNPPQIGAAQQLQAQAGELDAWPELRARRRALQAARWESKT